MFNIEEDINWKLFNEEEKKQIIHCYSHDEWHNLCCLPGVEIDKPEKEQEIEKIAIEMRGIDITDESVVRDELEKFWAKGEQIDSPEKEAEWQKKIDKENKEKEDKLKEELTEKKEEKTDNKIEEPAKEKVEEVNK